MADVEDDKLETITVISEEKLSSEASVRSDAQEDSKGNIDDKGEILDKGNARKGQFDSVNLDEGSVSDIDEDGDDEGDDDGVFKDDQHKRKRFKKKKPKHVSIENDSSSDEDDKRQDNSSVNPSDLTWFLWMWYYIRAVSSGALRAAEFLGEKLASFFGITTPKYQYVIDEYYRLKELEKEEEEKEQKEQEFVAERKMEELSKMEGGNQELVYNQVSSLTVTHAAIS